MAAQEEPRPQGLERLDDPPVGHVDDADAAFLEVGGRHHGPAAVAPRDARAQVRQAGQIEAGDLAPDVEVDHDRAPALARRAEQVAVGGVEEEVVERLLDGDPAQGEQPLRGGQGLLHARLVRMHHAGIDRPRALVGGDLPDLRDVLERHDEAVARPRLVDGADPRALPAPGVGRRDDAAQRQVRRIEQDERVRQVVGDREEPAVGRDGDVARVDPGANLGHHAQIVQVVLGDPAVARGEVDEAPVGRELGPAVQREAAGEAVDGLEAVAVEDGDVMVAAFHHHEEVEGIGREHGRVAERARRLVDDPAGRDLRLAPARRLRRRRVDEGGERLDLGAAEPIGEAGHLGGGPALGDHLGGLGLAQPAQALGQERRPLPAQARRPVARGAVLRVQPGAVGLGRGAPAGGCEPERDGDEQRAGRAIAPPGHASVSGTG